jgi:general secretion pathway protein I
VIRAATDGGFTLLEVLIALSILAISALAVLSQTGQSLSQLQQLSAKSSALYLAENQMQQLLSLEQWPPLGSQRNSIEQFQQQWQLDTNVSGTSDPLLRKITVTAGSTNTPLLIELVSYRGRY